MTVKELKEYYFNFLKITLKPKINVSDDYEVTEYDFESGRIFQKYVPSETLAKIVNGFTVIEHKIYYVYAKIYRIEILADNFFPPCGGESEVMVNAVYAVRGLSTFNTDILINGNNTCMCPVNALIKIDNPLFLYEKPYLINEKPNNTDENQEVNINATYYYKGVKYEAYKTIVQRINTNTSWLIQEEPTNKIKLILSENEVSNKGGIVLARVERDFTRIYYKKDSCGNKIAEKSESGLTEDITNKCLITSSNKKQFSVAKNVITISKQNVGALKRECTFTARYMDKTDTAVLVQKEGGKITYKYELTFSDGNKIQLFDLESSLPIEKKINIISKKYKFIDNEYDSVSNTNEIKIQSDSDWVYGITGEDEFGINVTIKVTEPNIDKYNDREATILITSTQNPDLSIKLIVFQQSLEVIREEYRCFFSDNGEYTTTEIDNKRFYFHPYKTLIYENGQEENISIDNDIVAKYTFFSENEKKFSIKSIKKDGEDYVICFNNFSYDSVKDIKLETSLLLYNKENKRVFESEKAVVIAKGNEIIDYNYELCFNGHNKFEKIVWDKSAEPKSIKINSIKHKMINGKYAGNEKVPIKISLYDETGKEIFDKSFSIKIFYDEILVFPIVYDKDVSNTYTITQKDSGEKIQFSLEYKSEKTYLNIPFKIEVYSNNVGKDIWTDENGYLLIDGTERIKLNPCWLSPNMKDNVDIAFDGYIKLEEGVHTFETFNVLCLESETKLHKDCNIYNEIKVDKTTKNIILQIKI